MRASVCETERGSNLFSFGSCFPNLLKRLFLRIPSLKNADLNWFDGGFTAAPDVFLGLGVLHQIPFNARNIPVNVSAPEVCPKWSTRAAVWRKVVAVALGT